MKYKSLPLLQTSSLSRQAFQKASWPLPTIWNELSSVAQVIMRANTGKSVLPCAQILCTNQINVFSYKKDVYKKHEAEIRQKLRKIEET